ncbi:MAG: hypothetical protein H0T46_06220 [Deltaproteobacteria bacterium]|nr:hypothetical protein [Deltaproteobacteria bacterium]
MGHDRTDRSLQSGNADEELATLKHLAERYPRHEHGGLAVKSLAKRGL